MISAARMNNSRRGFTLLEIVIVLALAAVLMGGAVSIMVYSSSERTLRNAAGEIELLAKQARTSAILHQTSYALEFRQGIVRLIPLAQAAADSLDAMKSGDDTTPAAGKKLQAVLQDGIGLQIRRWNSNDWVSIVKDDADIWRFDPDGLCEPISIHLSYKDSWIEETFHPLTASSIPEEKASEFR